MLGAGIGSCTSKNDVKFRPCLGLMYLVLRRNPIGSVHRFQFQFHSLFLSYVDLSECHLSAVPRGLPASIRYLQLRRNNMSAIHRTSFRDCPFVSILVLDENSISEVSGRIFFSACTHPSDCIGTEISKI